jgi:hypothetical protein
MAPFLPVRATSRSQRVRIGKQTVKTGATTYVDLASQVETNGIKAGSSLPYSPFKELQNHLAIGAVFVAGGITNSSSDTVVFSGVTATKAKGGAGEKTEVVVTAGELLTRSTAAYQAVAAKTETLNEVAAAKERIDIVTVKVSNGVIKSTEGVEALVGAAVQPATPAGEILLFTLKSTNKNTTNVLTDVRPRA